jgi:hypothetical protein
VHQAYGGFSGNESSQLIIPLPGQLFNSAVVGLTDEQLGEVSDNDTAWPLPLTANFRLVK